MHFVLLLHLFFNFFFFFHFFFSQNKKSESESAGVTMTLLRYVGKFEKKIVFLRQRKMLSKSVFSLFQKKIFFLFFFGKSVRLTEFSFFFPNFPLFLPYYTSHLSRVSRGKWLFFSPKFCVGVRWCLLATHRASTPPQEVR